jgi:hypothetical protein
MTSPSTAHHRSALSLAHFGAFSIYSQVLHARHRSHAWTTYACSSCMWAMRSFIMRVGHALVRHTCGPCARSSCMWATLVHITLVQPILVHTALVSITRPLHLPTTRIVPMHHPLPKGCASDDKPIHRSPSLSALARPFGWVTPSRVWFPPALPRLSWHHFGAFSIYSRVLHARHRSHAWTTYACSSCMWAMRSFIMHMGHALVHHTCGPCARSSCMWANNFPRLHRATTRTALRHSISCKCPLYIPTQYHTSHYTGSHYHAWFTLPRFTLP